MDVHTVPEIVRAVANRQRLAAEARTRVMATPQVDLDDPARNMFGLLPCPRCGDPYRWPTRPDHPEHPDVILCDRCGLTEAKVKT
jgi:hypothetical protein